MVHFTATWSFDTLNPDNLPISQCAIIQTSDIFLMLDNISDSKGIHTFLSALHGYL